MAERESDGRSMYCLVSRIVVANGRRELAKDDINHILNYMLG